MIEVTLNPAYKTRLMLYKLKSTFKLVGTTSYVTTLTVVTQITPVVKFVRNQTMNDTTRKFPRTLAEAFPDSPQPNFEKTMDKEDQLVIISALIITGVLIMLAVVGVI